MSERMDMPAVSDADSLDTRVNDHDEALRRGLAAADQFINRHYLVDLDNQYVRDVSPDDISSDAIRLLRIDHLVFDDDEISSDKLISVYSALQSLNSTVMMIIHSKNNEVSVYLGARSLSTAVVSCQILEKSIVGNFPGSRMTPLEDCEIQELMNNISENFLTRKSVVSVSVDPSFRNEDGESFVQGLEKMIDTMSGTEYMAILLAEPLSSEELETRKRGFEEMYSTISSFAKTTLAYGENFSSAVADGIFQNFTDTVNNSITNTNGKSEGTSHSDTVGTGDSTGIHFDYVDFGHSRNRSSTDTYSSSYNWSKAVTTGTATSTGHGDSTTLTHTAGNSRTLTIEHRNKSVEELMERIDEILGRLKTCETFGIWNFAAYFISGSVQNATIAANTYRALMLGEKQQQSDRSYINSWSDRSDRKTVLLKYLKNGMHPVMEIDMGGGLSPQTVTPCTLVSGADLPLLMGLPQKSVSGLTVTRMAEFARNIDRPPLRDSYRPIRVGFIKHMGVVTAKPVELDLNSFTGHCFVCGTTGCGKSNTVYGIIDRMLQNDVLFLVIEPAKGEYKDQYAGVPGIHIYTTNPFIGKILKINPFRFDPGIHILEHLDRLIEIFNACWDMEAAMPAVLKDAMERAYVSLGWDLLNSVYTGGETPRYPTLEDLLRELPRVISESRYSDEVKGNYTGALVTRVRSLTNGILGQIFCDCYDIDDRTLFDENTIIDLSRVGSSETKALIMGILVLKITEYRMTRDLGANLPLRHVTVLEEAHNLLKNRAGEKLATKSVEMICNSISEVRTYGEGFVIVDQSPTAVDLAAIKNTNTKIIMRLPEKTDCEIVGNAVALSEKQIRELSRLETGSAVVMQSNWHEAVVTQIDPAGRAYAGTVERSTLADLKLLRGRLVTELLYQNERGYFHRDPLSEIIWDTPAPYCKKQELQDCVEQMVGRLELSPNNRDFFCLLQSVSAVSELFPTLEGYLRKEGDGYTAESIAAWVGEFTSRSKFYLELSNSQRKVLLRKLILSMAAESHTVQYARLIGRV